MTLENHQIILIIILSLSIVGIGYGVFNLLQEPTQEPAPEPEYVGIEEPDKVMFVQFAWKYYDEVVIGHKDIQGLVAEVESNVIHFASGNSHRINGIHEQVSVGDIITIDMQLIEREPCELAYLLLNNGTIFVNDRDEISSEQDQVSVSGETLTEVWGDFEPSDSAWRYLHSDMVPYDPYVTCMDYERPVLKSIDGHLAEEMGLTP